MTTTTATRTGRKAFPVYGLKNLEGLGEPAGTFSAIVAVFGNVDYANDRIVAGAFASSLAKWKASGDPIPVIFSHQWDNLDAHIGEVVDSKELLPGDPLLDGTGLEANGGLWTKFLLAVEEDFAGRVAKRLDARTLKEFSFAYDVLSERTASDGVNELLVLDVIEVGPTLKGMNPSTALLARAMKAAQDAGVSSVGDEILSDLREIGADDLADELEAAVKSKAAVAHAFAAGELDPSRCVLCGLTRNAAGHRLASDEPEGSKAWVTLTGSAEEFQEAAFAAAYQWAADGNIGEGGFYTAYLEATFGDRLVVLVEGWDDPVGEGTYYELDVAFDGAEATVSNPRAVALEAVTVAKSRAMKFRTRPGSATGEKSAATVSGDDEPGKGKAKSDELEEPGPRTGSDGDTDAGLPAAADLDLALLGAGLDPTDS